jgi:hypothetical protein
VLADSGGPDFLGNSNVVVSLTALGDAARRASDKTYRLDTASARGFLASQGFPCRSDRDIAGPPVRLIN